MVMVLMVAMLAAVLVVAVAMAVVIMGLWVRGWYWLCGDGAGGMLPISFQVEIAGDKVVPQVPVVELVVPQETTDGETKGAKENEAAAEQAPDPDSKEGTGKMEEASPGKASSRSDAGSTVSKKHVLGLERLSVMLREFIAQSGIHAPQMNDPNKIMCFAHMEAVKEGLLNSSSIHVLDANVKLLEDALAAAKSFKDGVVKAGASLKSHIENKKRGHERDEKNKKVAADQAVVKEEQKKAKEAANRVKVEEAQAPPLFKLDYAGMLSQGCLISLEPVVNDPKNPLAIDLPVLLSDKAVEAVTKWHSTSKVQLALGTFGGSYKKKPQLKEDLRIQQAMAKQAGKEETDAMFNCLFELLPKGSRVSDKKVERLLDNTWLFGFDTNLKVYASENGHRHHLHLSPHSTTTIAIAIATG